MRKRNIVIWLCAVTVVVSFSAGCGQKAGTLPQETTAAQDAEMSQAGTENPVPEAPELREGARIVRVTKITENTITAEEGTFERPSPPDIPEDGEGPGEGSRPGEGRAPDEGGRPGEGRALFWKLFLTHRIGPSKS